MTSARAAGPEPGDLVREDAGASATVRQLGGFLLVAALILALVRLLRGSRQSRPSAVARDGEGQ